MNTYFAYDIPDSARQELGIVPNLRFAAEQPFMGLTAFLSEKPYLVIGRDKEAYYMEDQYGEVLRVDFDFPWEMPRVASNRLVAASRTEASPFKNAGLLNYDEATGEWAIRDGISNMRFPLESRVAALEENGWKLSVDFDEKDVVIPVHGRCPNCGSDSISYAEDEDEDTHPIQDNNFTTSSADDPVVLCHACHQWCKESELKTTDDDAGGNQNRDEAEGKKLTSFRSQATEAFSFQGKGFISPHTTEGIAIMPEVQSQEEMAMMIGNLATPQEQIREHHEQQNAEHGTSFPLHDSPFINRGGSVKEALYPEQFKGGPFIVVAKWLTPEMTVMFHDETPGGRGTDKRLRGFVTELGGPGSHAFVVASPLSVPVIVVAGHGDQIDRIQPGDHLRIDGQTGVVEVNGGDPNFVAQDPNSITVSTPLYRFAYANGTGHVEQMTPGQMVGDKGGHGGMMNLLMQSGHGQVDMETFNHNMSFGFLCDDGTIIQDKNPIQDQEAFEQWAHQQESELGLPQGHIQRLDVSAYVPPEQKIDENSTVPLTGVDENVHASATKGDKNEEALKCPECDSHTIESYYLDEPNGMGEFGCLTCGNAFKAPYRKTAADKGKHNPGTRVELNHRNVHGRGSILEFAGKHPDLDEESYHIQLDSGDKLEDIPESAFKKIKSASLDEDDSEDVPDWFVKELNRQLVESLAIETFGSFMKGAPYPENSYENAPDHSPKGQKSWPKEVNAIYNACMREDNGSGDSKEEKESSCARIAWAQYKKTKKEKGHGNTKPEKKKSTADEPYDGSECDRCGHGAFQHNGPSDSCEECSCDRFEPTYKKKSAFVKEGIFAALVDLLNAGADLTARASSTGVEAMGGVMRAAIGPANPLDDALGFAGGSGSEVKKDASSDEESKKKALDAFCEKLPLVLRDIEQHEPSDEVRELDELIEAAFPGYKGKESDGKDDSDKEAAWFPHSGETDKDDAVVTCPKCGGELVYTGEHGAKCRNCDYSPVTGAKKPTLPKDVLTGVDGGRWGEAYEGHPVMCYMCGNQRGAKLGSACEHCGYPLMVRRDGPTASKPWPKSAALEPGSWYTMHSPTYKVPDVIHVKEVTDEGITASIEGDDKGLFPIHLRHEEIEKEQYSFEPYTTPTVDSSPGDNRSAALTRKEARRNYSQSEQKALVNESPDARARNFHKLNLEGTHYPTDLDADDDILSKTIFWW